MQSHRFSDGGCLNKILVEGKKLHPPLIVLTLHIILYAIPELVLSVVVGELSLLRRGLQQVLPATIIRPSRKNQIRIQPSRKTQIRI